MTGGTHEAQATANTEATAKTQATTSDSSVTKDVVALARRIGTEVAGPFAAEVDSGARFPKETIDALRAEGLLGALIPAELGGLGHDLSQAASVVRELARYCASSAMVLAMHHIQVASLIRHGGTRALFDFTRRVSAEQLLLASATTEIGIGGNTRNSSCAVQLDGDTFTLTKQAPVISYGQYADAFLTTARRTPESPASDQVLAICLAADVSLEPLSGWDTLGFRGTCSLGFTLTARGSAELICADSFADISSCTMLPVAHLLWSSLWLGIAEEATARAQRFVQQAARKDLSTTPPGATRLAALLVTTQQLATGVDSFMMRYQQAVDGDLAAATSRIDFMVAVNTLKVSASTLVVDVVNQAMLICGIMGYREDSPFSLGRLLRDAHGAAIMVNNDRIAMNTAQLALAQRGL